MRRRRGLERLLRKLMRMPGQPAVVYVHYWAGLMMRRFIDTAEDAIEAVVAAVVAAAVFARKAVDGEVNPAEETAIAIQTKQGAAQVILQNAPALLAELRELRTGGKARAT